jgi:predicted Zn finger-like uncharacterized protein
VFTRCPDCATVFRVTADALRVAQGDVRCGVCSNTFNAVEHLSEQAFTPDAEEAESPTAGDSMTVEELPGNENIELSEEAAMEFHGDAADIDRLFVVESPPTPENFDPAKVAASLTLAEGTNELDRTDEYPILVLDEQDLPEDPKPEEKFAPVADAFGSASRILIPDEMRKQLAEEQAAHNELATDFGPVEEPAEHRRWPWTAGAALALLLFFVQVVHSQREQLARESGVGPWLARTYALIGMPLDSPTDLSAYELRQWGAANDPREAERLMLRASIVNRAPYAQPLPLLRLALQDRFGATIRMRDIQPADYLPGTGAPRMLGPGQRADAEIRIVDPGRDAVGFEMDVCLAEDGSVRCANQAAPAAP